MAHTPGPWAVEPGDGGDPSVGMGATPTVVFVSIPNDDRGFSIDIAEINDTIYHNDEDGNPLYWGDADANANLIAAAPELLDALEALCFHVETGWIPPDNLADYTPEGVWDMACRAFRDSRAYQEARAVIAKARGERVK